MRSGEYTRFAKLATLEQIKPDVVGFSEEGRIAVIFPAVTSTSRLQVSGQSIVQTDGLIDRNCSAIYFLNSCNWQNGGWKTNNLRTRLIVQIAFDFHITLRIRF